jgi:hypothetical protein
MAHVESSEPRRQAIGKFVDVTTKTMTAAGLQLGLDDEEFMIAVSTILGLVVSSYAEEDRPSVLKVVTDGAIKVAPEFERETKARAAAFFKNRVVQ